MEKRFHDIFGPGANLQKRIFRDYDTLAKQVEAMRELGLKIVLTSGVFDMFHEGHARYLAAAKECGDVLIVGVDSNALVRSTKGDRRPIVDEEQRMEIICHTRHADLVFLKPLGDHIWKLIQVVRPNVLILPDELAEHVEALKKFCGEVKVLERMAATSTTAKVRLLMKEGASDVLARLRALTSDVEKIMNGGE